MKRILKSLAKLYPATWRSRYGAEYEALLEDRTPRAGDAFDVLRGALATHITSRSFVTIVLPCALAGGLAALAVSFKVPPSYTSGNEWIQVTRYLPEDGPRPPSEAVVVSVGSRPTSYAGPYGDLMRAINCPSPRPWYCEPLVIDGHDVPYNDSLQGVFNRNSLAELIRKYELYPRERARKPLDKVILRMQSAIKVRYTSRLTSARYSARDSLGWRTPMDSAQKIEENFAVQFTYPDAQVAQKVDEELGRLLDHAVLHRFSDRGPIWGTTHDPALADRDFPDFGFSFLPASLPRRPNGLSRGAECGIGMLAGILAGLLLAATLGSRPREPSANS